MTGLSFARPGALALLLVAGAGWTLATPDIAPRAARRVVIQGYPGGGLRREAEYRGDRLEGITRGWYPNGALEYERSYHEGREEGVHRGWYLDGSPMFVYRYHRGLGEGLQEQWYPDGTPLLRLQQVHGQESGLQQMWNPDGSVRSSYVIRNGRRYGLVGAVGCTGRAAAPRAES